MRIIYSKQASKAIEAMPKSRKQKIKVAIERLPKGDTKPIKLRGVLTNRLRVGGWRVLYYFDSRGDLFIEKIGPRGDVYKV
ncbi:MAG: type II toxin-antitoxin system RelE/ParE family toxin [Clostridiales bacterium]|jgi:mRNA interferase RelE/StbE|nr:type II toxin-antitoxin system RelE/ParE family toxin [Clostridiales bacterium]